jgi:hypothetical protein
MTTSIRTLLACCLLTWLATGCSDDSEASEVTDEKPSSDARSERGDGDNPRASTETSGRTDDEDDSEATATADEDAKPNEEEESTTVADELDYTGDIRGNCDIESGYPDDHACIPAPKPEEGLQIHVGPSNYDDEAEVAKFIMEPGEESSECFTFKTSNPEEVTYQSSVLSGRAGTHHIINTMFSGDLPTGDFSACAGPTAADQGLMQIGALPGASRPYMPRTKVAPEYAHVGRTIAANALVQADMHYFNFTDKDILREFWINVYYAPEGAVTEYAKGIRGLGGFGWNQNPIEPGTDMVYKYECPIKGDGYIMNLLGHYHAHGKRFTSHVKRTNGQIDKVFEMYDYLEPATFDYNSVTQNPDFSDDMPGAVSGQLAVSDGDILQWECHIINDGDVGLRYINEVKNGEMCNLWGFSLGTEQIACGLR